MILKPKKEKVIATAKQLTPQYLELLQDLQKGNGRISFTAEIAAIQNHLGKYVLVYDSEYKIARALFLFILGENGFKEYTAEIEAASPEEQQEIIDGFVDVEDDSLVELFSDIHIPNGKQLERH